VIYKLCLATHNNKPKVFRITVHEKLLNEIVDCMKLTVLANTKKKSKKEIESAINDLRIMRGKIEIIKAYTIIAWELNYYSHEFFADINNRLEQVSKQTASWEKWFTKQ